MTENMEDLDVGMVVQFSNKDGIEIYAIYDGDTATIVSISDIEGDPIPILLEIDHEGEEVKMWCSSKCVEITDDAGARTARPIRKQLVFIVGVKEKERVANEYEFEEGTKVLSKNNVDGIAEGSLGTVVNIERETNSAIVAFYISGTRMTRRCKYENLTPIDFLSGNEKPREIYQCIKEQILQNKGPNDPNKSTKMRHIKAFSFEVELGYSENAQVMASVMAENGFDIGRDPSVNSLYHAYEIKNEDGRYFTSWSDFKERAKHIFDYAAEANASMGLHVHVSFKNENVGYILASREFYHFFIEGIKDEPFYEKSGRLKHRVENGVSWVEKNITSNDIFEQVRDDSKSGRRYRQINFCLSYMGTVEFRIWPGETDFNRVKQYMAYTISKVNDYLDWYMSRNEINETCLCESEYFVIIEEEMI